MAYVAAGNYVGEMGLLGNSTRSASVRATVAETVSLDTEAFNALLDATPAPGRDGAGRSHALAAKRARTG